MKPGATTWPDASRVRVALHVVADLRDEPIGDGHVGAPAGRTTPVDNGAAGDHEIGCHAIASRTRCRGLRIDLIAHRAKLTLVSGPC